MVCRIVRRLLILVHKWQFPGYDWPPWILIQTLPTNFSWAKSHTFFIMQKSKFTEILNICSNWLLLQSIKETCFQQMLNIHVNVEFCIMQKLWDLAHEKLVKPFFCSRQRIKNSKKGFKKRASLQNLGPSYFVRALAGHRVWINMI